MFLEFPSDRTTHHLDAQYMLGSALLVAPVFVHEGEESEYYLPAGRWTAFFHPERTLDGPTWVREIVPVDEIPVWVRPGSVLCLGPAGTGRPDYELAGDVEVQVYEIADGQAVEALVPTGKQKEIAGTVKVERRGEQVSLAVSGGVGVTSLALFANGKVTKHEVRKDQTELTVSI